MSDKKVKPFIKSKFVIKGVEVRFSKGKGRGVFAIKPFKKNEIIECSPAIVIKHNKNLLCHTELSHYLFEGESNDHNDSNDTVLIGLGYTSIYNYAPEPNADFETHTDLVIIRATKDIDGGEEITVDYGWDIDTLYETGIYL